MEKKQLKRQNLIKMALGIIIILLIAYISSFVHSRFDLTSEKRFTLAPASKEILKKLDDVVYVKVYLDGDMPVSFKRMRTAIKELLDEFRVVAKKNIEYQFISPSENSDTKVREQVYADLFKKGLKPTNIQAKDAEGATTQRVLIPGVLISYNGVELPVNLLKNNPSLGADENLNNSIESMEYSFISVISNLTNKKPQKIAFIEGHGEWDQYQTGDITKDLANFYQVDRGAINGKPGCMDTYAVIIIAGPQKPFNEADKFVIDQYIMKGGKVLWFIDGVKVSMDSLVRGSTVAFINSLNLDDMLFRYDIRVNPNLVQDVQCSIIPVNIALEGEQAKWTPAPWLYYPLITPSSEHPLSKNVNLIRTQFVSTIDTVGNDLSVKKTVILRSSQYTKLVNVPVMISLEEFKQNPAKQDFNKPFQPVGLLLEGSFKSVFKNRLISGFVKTQNYVLRDSSVNTKMIVVADADIVRNDIRNSPKGPVIATLGYDRYTRQTFGNKEFILNAVNYLTDENGLLNVRSREIKLRLLDKEKVTADKFEWQLINILFPLAIVLIFGLVIKLIRIRKYAV
jgi:ABC-2 type transport system permease protein